MENSRHLLQLINDLLEFTKAEIGKMDYNIEEINVNDILNIAYNNTASLLYGTEIEFKLSLHKENPIVMVDSRRFLQIVLNLLSNSIKFTKKGSIKLKSFVEKDQVVIEVADTGKGIPNEKYQMIFDPFTQVKNTDSGTGLGLGIAKKMCDDMDIEMTFTSIEGSGTIFRLKIKKTV